jgi:hypothetical protein
LTTAIVVVPVPKEFHGLANLLNVDGSLFTITKAGYILRMTPPGVFSLEEVNNMRFSARERTARWRNLDEIASRLNIPTISILGIKDSHGFCVPIWYHRGSIIITLHELHGIAVRLLGFQLKDCSLALLVGGPAPRQAVQPGSHYSHSTGAGRRPHRGGHYPRINTCPSGIHRVSCRHDRCRPDIYRHRRRLVSAARRRV